MVDALKAAKVTESDYTVLTLPESEEHGFEYWDSYDLTPSVFGLPPDIARTVHDDVVFFLDRNLKECADCKKSALKRAKENKHDNAK